MCFDFSWRQLCPNGRCVERGENWFPWPFGMAWCCSPTVRHRLENQVKVRQGCPPLALPAGLVIASLVMKTILVHSERKAQNESLEPNRVCEALRMWPFHERAFQGPFLWQYQHSELSDSSRRNLHGWNSPLCYPVEYHWCWGMMGIRKWELVERAGFRETTRRQNLAWHVAEELTYMRIVATA